MVLSIIIPVYNGQTYLEETLNRVLRFRDYSVEVIIIDDGSTDGSYEIYSRFAEEDDRVKIFAQKNQGIVAARNMGMKKAKGDFVCFVDQDDMIHVETYERAMVAAEKNHSDVCFFSTQKYWDENTLEDLGIVKEEGEFEREGIKSRFLLPLLVQEYRDKGADTLLGHVWAAIYRRSFLEENDIHFFRFIDYEDDVLFIMQCLSRAKRISAIKDVGYWWRMNRQSESYRVKYIENLYEKEQQLFQYIKETLNGGSFCEPSVYQTFLMRYEQNILLKCVENDCVYLNHQQAKQIFQEWSGFFEKNGKEQLKILNADVTLRNNSTKAELIRKCITGKRYRKVYWILWIHSLWLHLKNRWNI
ncbi:MAG: glycosyltransferase [Clostridiales bacterium]|nr:glycosyltransferase [Clostridiales bacterium]